MRAIDRHSQRHAFSLIELVVIIALAVMLVLTYQASRPRASAPRINCVNHLRQVGLAFRVWGLDHDDLFPMQASITNGGMMEYITTAKAFRHYQILSNELNTPRVLICPADKKRTAATNFFVGFKNQNLSYFVGVDATPTNPPVFLAGDRNLTNGILQNGFMEFTTNDLVSWTSDLHNLQGNICFADGSVQQLSSKRLQQMIRFMPATTNRLAMP